jgi:hypothetical protein
MNKDSFVALPTREQDVNIKLYIVRGSRIHIRLISTVAFFIRT